ncbi:hypothetical protein [Flavobacterium granuli]|uniref:Uncharacterized protein n=1 Tax=Flavobacterium granuli TaxID=280093 RepID=A0A1M5R0U9_9FLAO|nr:hypothetical protein [Flavobacterium granuli]PRZ21571.1 hypothetical protein BC624_1089 [Flavobacterium granuli]SHH20067.1 hypothetical protein SAMN05443373_1099 [Flavobacterium granuli]
MEVICKEEQLRFVGGSGGYTWQQFVDAVNSGNLSSIPAGSYIMSSSGDSFSFFGEGLNEVIVLDKTPAYSSSGYSSWSWTNTTTGGSGSFFLDSIGYSDFYNGGSGSTSNGGDSPVDSFVNSMLSLVDSSDDNPYRNWTLETVANVFHGMGDSVNDFGIVLNATGIGAEVGVPLMTFGGTISLIGTGIDFFIDLRDNTIQSFDYAAWAITVGLEANSIVFGKFTTTTGEKIIFELSQNGIEYIKE